jgi:hypothetical protein
MFLWRKGRRWSLIEGYICGYSETSKAYKIYILAQRKTIVSRDVKFEENLTSRSTQESSTMIEDEEQHAPKDEQQLAVQTCVRI